MMLEAIEIWKEIERRVGEEILVKCGFLYVKRPDTKEFKEFLKYGKRMTAKEIRERWSEFRVPDYLEGAYSEEGGVVKVKVAL